jgi:hypothetical protein
VDNTCILTTEYIVDENTGEYTYEYVKQSGWPTLYYNETTSQFCWAINGQPTGVNAQGVNGKDGIGSKVWLVELETPTGGSTTSKSLIEQNDYINFPISKVWYPNSVKWVNKADMDDAL